MRMREREGDAGVIEDGEPGTPNPRVVKPKYLDIRWQHTETLPAHLLVGFHVAVFTGDNPNDTDAYLVEPLRVGPSERRAVVPVRLASAQNVRCAVQALYSNGNQSSWRVLGGAVATDPDTVTMAVQDLSNVPVGAVKAAHLGEAVVGSAHVAPGAIATQHLLLPPSDNLVPNGYSEAGAAALGKSPEGDALVEEPAHAKEGRWCRKVVLPSAQGLNFTGGIRSAAPSRIKCAPGDQFYAELWVKVSAPLVGNAAALYLLWLNTDGVYAGQFSAKAVSGNLIDSSGVGGRPISTTYQKLTLTGTCPAGCTGVELYWEGPAQVAADVGKALYFDAVSMRKMVTFDLLTANTLKTSNYAEDGNGKPTAGVKLDNVGTSLKAASANVQVGSVLLTDPLFRSLQALGGTNCTFYRGSIDTAVSGGVPNIDAFEVQVTEQYVNAAGSWVVHNLFVSPALWANNLDALRYAVVDYWKGTAASAVYRGTRYFPLTDRKYVSLTDARNAANDSAASLYFTFAEYFGGLTTVSPYLFLKVRVANVYGVSAERWFVPGANLNTHFTRTAVAPFGGAPATGGTSGGDSGSGACPAPWEPILLASGREVPADAVRVGDFVLTSDQHSLRPGLHRVTHAELVPDAWRWRLEMEDGRVLVAQRNHLMYQRGRGFTPLRKLRPGDVLQGVQEGRVRSVRPQDKGPVVKLSVEGAETYVNQGLLSHNRKPTD